VNDRELRAALRDAAGDDGPARARAWRVVRAAYAGHRPRPRRARWPAGVAAAVVLASAAAVGGAAARAPHSSLGHLVRDVLGVGAPRARPALGRLPGGGRLLVDAGASTWVVAADGSRRRLGAYAGASWSPHGLFVVAWGHRVLSAVDPRGGVRWSLTRPQAITAARWAPGDGFRVAYLSGGALRIVAGDGTGDHRYAAAGAVAPAWRPGARHVLAYADPASRITVAAVDTRRRAWHSAPLAGLVQLAWSPRGDRLLALTGRRMLLFDAAGRRVAARSLPGSAAAAQAAWAPDARHVALVRRGAAAGGSEVMVVAASGKLPARPLFRGPGRLAGLAWSPDGRTLLLGWADADQWLFLRPSERKPFTAVAGIARQFSPGASRPPFPSGVAWCCTPGG
jgi:hypothetical protein